MPVGFQRTSAAVVLVVALVLVLSACGGSSSSSSSANSSSSTGAGSTSDAAATTASPTIGPASGEVVAKVGATPITKGQVNHWMATLAGGDYYELSRKHTIPANLVSDPPRYAVCVSQLEAAAAAAPRKLYTVSGVQLLTKCRQLYQALRSQATAYLVRALFVDGLSSDFEVSATDPEVLAFYKRATATRFPNQEGVTRYLTDTRATLSDELLVDKLDLLSQKTLERIKAQGSEGQTALQRSEARWTAKTDCRAGYIVEHCKQYRGEPPRTAANPPASVLMEQIAALAIGRCTNLAACGKP
jgi:hypothetical protein